MSQLLYQCAQMRPRLPAPAVSEQPYWRAVQGPPVLFRWPLILQFIFWSIQLFIQTRVVVCLWRNMYGRLTLDILFVPWGWRFREHDVSAMSILLSSVILVHPAMQRSELLLFVKTIINQKKRGTFCSIRYWNSSLIIKICVFSS